jgi:ubiquitin-protein ligase
VSNDDKGSMCLGILRSDEWKPSSKIADVLRFANQLLVEPNPDDAVEQSIAHEYKEQRQEGSGVDYQICNGKSQG